MPQGSVSVRGLRPQSPPSWPKAAVGGTLSNPIVTSASADLTKFATGNFQDAERRNLRAPFGNLVCKYGGGHE